MTDFVNRFGDLWKRIKAKGDYRQLFWELREKYAQPNRVYHTLEHISYCLDNFIPVRKFAENPDTVEFAIWYHDFEKDEKDSARIARTVCRSVGLPESFAQRTYNLILATMHSEMPRTIDTKLICDLDLLILGAPEKEFDNYESKIRKEYPDASDQDFAKGRVAILEKFLARPTIYSTSFFKQKERQARANLIMSIVALRNSFKQ